MNFARVNCDQRATQGVMRNVAFALQARNQFKRSDRFVVRGYRRAAEPKMFCVARAESAINRTRSTKSVGENGSAQINSSTRRSTPRRSDIVASSKPDEDRPTAVSSALPPRVARRRNNLRPIRSRGGQHAGRVSGLGPTPFAPAPGKREFVAQELIKPL